MNAVGDLEFLSGGAFSLNARNAILNGESFVMSSGSGGIVIDAEDIESISPSFTINTVKDIDIRSIGLQNSDVILNAQQSIEMKSSSTNLSSATLNVDAQRNNIFLQAYRELELDANSFDVNAKGDASFVAANGNLFFNGMNHVNFRATDDIELNASESVTFTTNGDAIYTSRGNTFFLSDSEQIYNYNVEGTFNSTLSFQTVSGRLDIESSAGNIIYNVGDDFGTSSADYTNFLGDFQVLFTAFDDIELASLQGIDMRAERGRLYIGKFPADPSGDTPITFIADELLSFDAGDLRINVESTEIIGNYVRFETADQNRQSVQNWDLENNMEFNVTNRFIVTSASSEFIADDDLVFVSLNDDVFFLGSGDKGSTVSVFNEFDITDVSNGDIDFEANRVTLMASGPASFTADNRVIFEGTSGIFVNSDTTITFTIPDDFDNTVNQNLEYIAGNDISITATGSFDYFAGAIYFDSRQNFDISSANSLFDGETIDFDADGDARYSISGFTSFSASDNILINGDQDYTFSDLIINGDVVLTSPPGLDIGFTGNDVTINGNGVYLSYDIVFDIDNQIQFTPFSFNLQSTFEEDITLTTGNDFEIYSDELTFSNRFVDRDNEFYFTSGANIEIDATDDASFIFTNFIEFESDTSIFIGNSYSASMASKEFTATSGNLIDIEVASDIFFGVETKIDFVSYESNIRFFATEDILIDSDSESFFRTNNLEYLASTTLDMFFGREFTYTGGDISITGTTSVEFQTLSDDIIIHGFESILLNTNRNIINAPDLIRFYAPDIILNTNGLSSFTITSDIDIRSGEGDFFYLQQLNNAIPVDISGISIDYQSNDEFIGDFGNNWSVICDSILLESSAQDAGQLYYSTTNFDFTSDTINLQVRDSSYDGKDILFEFSTNADFNIVNRIDFIANGSEYDSQFDTNFGNLYRSESRNIIFNSGNDMIQTSVLDLSITSLDGSISHTSNNVLAVTSGGLVATAGVDINFDSDGTWNVTLNSYSNWQASDTIDMTISNGQYFLNSAGDIDIVADRGTVLFEHEGTGELFLESGKSINSVGANDFNWDFDGDVDNTAQTYIELYGHSVSISADGNTTLSTVGDAYFISSLNYDIDFSSGADVIQQADGSISFYGRRSTVISGTGANNTFTAGTDINLISEGNILIESTANIEFLSIANIEITNGNSLVIDGFNEINFGDSTGLIAISAGGDTNDYGFFTETVTARTDSGSDLIFTAGQFEMEYVTSEFLINNVFTLESENDDVILEGIFETVLSNGNSTISANIIEYNYDDFLRFESLSSDVTINSASFIEFDSAGNFGITGDTWISNDATRVYNSVGDTSFSSGNTMFFNVEETVSSESDRHTSFSMGSLDILTQGTNSPISFTTRDPLSDISIFSTSGPNTHSSVGKSTISGNHGVYLEGTSGIFLTSSDDFTITADGDISMSARDSSFSISGDTTQTTGSDFVIQSSGGLNMFTGETLSFSSGEDLLIIADRDITFHSMVTDEELIFDTSINIRISDDTLAEIDGNFTVYTSETFFVGNTIDWVFNGIWEESGIGAWFYSDFGTVSLSGAENLELVADDIYYEVSALSSLSTDASYNTENGMTFMTTESNSDINVFGNSISYSTSDNFNIMSMGDDLTSGYISVTGLAPSPGTEYPWFNLPYDIGLVANDSDMEFNIMDAQFFMESIDSISLIPDPNGDVLIQANGKDVNGNGIEVQGGDIEILSALNIVVRSGEDIEFIELFYDIYNSVGTFEAQAGITNFRPTIRTVHDQTYSSFGQNENGNGIELYSEASANDIVILSDNVHFGSTDNINIIGQTEVIFESNEDTNIISHSDIFVTGNSASDSDASILIHTRNEVTVESGRDIEIEAANDVYLSLSGDLIALGTNFVVTGGSVSITTEDDFNMNANDLFVSTDGDIYVKADDDLLINGVDLLFATIGLQQGDLFVGPPDTREANQCTADIAADTLTFNTRWVDIPSTNTFSIPAVNPGIINCGNSPNSFWFEADVQQYSIRFCDIDGNEGVVALF